MLKTSQARGDGTPSTYISLSTNPHVKVLTWGRAVNPLIHTFANITLHICQTLSHISHVRNSPDRLYMLPNRLRSEPSYAEMSASAWWHS